MEISGHTLVSQDQEWLTFAEAITRRRLHCTVVNGSVILKGQVRSYHDKIEAEKLVGRIPGVHSIQNRITVSAEKRSDAQLGAAVCEILASISNRKEDEIPYYKIFEV